MRDLILEAMTDLDELRERCLEAEEDLERARELLELWCDWYNSNRKNSLAPSVASRALLDA